jgi:hypothetical protein
VQFDGQVEWEDNKNIPPQFPKKLGRDYDIPSLSPIIVLNNTNKTPESQKGYRPIQMNLLQVSGLRKPKEGRRLPSLHCWLDPASFFDQDKDAGLAGREHVAE